MKVNSIQEILDRYSSSGKKRIVLVGNAASGKDYARKVLKTLGYQYQISYTTRPARSNEKQAEDYFFTSEETFKMLIRNNFFYEFVIFNGWYYGTSNAQMNRRDCVFIMTPKGLAHMGKQDRDDSLVVYFDISEDVIKQRISQRSDADTVERRLAADKIDFEGFNNYDLTIDNPNFE